MRLDSLTLVVPGAPGNGTPQRVRDLREKYVQMSGTFVGSFDIEVSLDGGNNYVLSVASITEPGVKSVPEPATHLRIVTTALASGTATAVVNGYNVRTDNG